MQLKKHVVQKPSVMCHTTTAKVKTIICFCPTIRHQYINICFIGMIHHRKTHKIKTKQRF